MAYEMKDGDFSLFRNDKKTAANQPDMRGKIMVGGVVYKLSAWSKGEGEKRFLAGKAEPDNYTPTAPKLPPSDTIPPIPSEPGNDRDDLPF